MYCVWVKVREFPLNEYGISMFCIVFLTSPIPQLLPYVTNRYCSGPLTITTRGLAGEVTVVLG